MNFDKFLRKIFYASAAVVAICAGTSYYNLYQFNITPGVSEASMTKVGDFEIRNYKDRREVANLLDSKNRVIANNYLDNIDKSNCVLGASGLVALLSTAGSIALLARKDKK